MSHNPRALDVAKKLVSAVIAALEHRDRISDIHNFDPVGSSITRVILSLLEQFPALTNLHLGASFSMPSLVLPETFLGGYAPRLRSFSLHFIAFPSFPEFVLRATHIVTIHLFGMPSSEYVSISPEVVATCLAALPDLEALSIRFELPPLSPLQTTLPSMPLLFPSLTYFLFVGVSEYLEDLIARLDTPLLDRLRIGFSTDFTASPLTPLNSTSSSVAHNASGRSIMQR